MCSTKCAKVVLIAFNILFFLLGIALLVGGILILVDKTFLTSALSNVPTAGQTLDQVTQYSSLLKNCAYAIIAVGAVIFIIGFCGCFGAMKEIKVLLVVYAIIVIVILLAQIAALVLGFLYTNTVISYLQTFLNQTINEKYEGLSITDGSLSESLEPYSAAWDIVMISLECCGNYNYSDFADYAVNWNKTYSYSGTTLTAKVPISCCKTTDKTKLISDMANFANYFTNSTACVLSADPTHTNLDTCYAKIVSYVNTYTWLVIGVLIAIALVELIAIIASCVIICSKPEIV